MMHKVVYLMFAIFSYVFEHANAQKFDQQARNFEHDFNVVHSDAGPSFKLKSRGRFKNVIDLDNLKGVKELKCSDSGIVLQLEEPSVASTWKIGDVITGIDKPDCKLGGNYGGGKGDLRKIGKITIVNNEVVIESSDASFVDVFENVDIFYHTGPSEYHRSKRSAASSWSTESQKLSKADVFSEIFPIHLNKSCSNKFIKDINFDRKSGNAGSSFTVGLTKRKEAVFDVKKNEWLRMAKKEQDDDVKKGTSTGAEINCASCFANFATAVTFELKISRDKDQRVVFEKYMLQFDVEASLSYTMSLTTKEEFSTEVLQRLWRAENPQTFQIPVSKDVSLVVSSTAELWLNASFEASAAMSLDTAFNTTSRFTVTSTKVADRMLKIDVLRDDAPVTINKSVVEKAADVSGTVSIFPQVEFETAFTWTVAESIFEMTLNAPFTVRVEPTVQMKFDVHSAMGYAMVGTFNANLTLDMVWEMKPTKLNMSVIGTLWEWDILTELQTAKTSLLKKPLYLASAERLTCAVEAVKPCNPPSTKPGKNRLMSLSEGNIVFTSSTPTMHPNMASMVLKFSKLIRKETGWENRKLIVKNPLDPSDMVVEGRLVTLDVTSSSSSAEDHALVMNKLSDLAICANFCNVKRSKHGVTVGVQPSLQPKNTRYLSIMPKAQPKKLRVFDLPVGEGDATIIQCPNGDVTLVDMGSRSSLDKGFWQSSHVSTFMGKENVHRIKHVFLTGTDDGHKNLLSDVVGQLPSINLHYSSSGSREMSSTLRRFTHIKIQQCLGAQQCPEKTVCPGVSLQILSSQIGSKSSESGLVLKLINAHFKMLFVGDVSEKQSVDLLKLNSDVTADVYKLGRHGSNRSEANTGSFLSAVKPKVVITSGDPTLIDRNPACSVLQEVLESENLLKASSSDARFRTQPTALCGNSSGKLVMSGSSGALYTHKQNENAVNLVTIEVDYSTKKVHVKPSFTGRDFPSLSWCGDRFPELSEGKSTDAEWSMDDVCLPIAAPITRDDERFHRLFYYYMNDVSFANGEATSKWCGVEGAPCPDCGNPDEDDDIMERCADRMMSFRLAFRLRRLAFLAGQEWRDTRTIQVQNAWKEPTSNSYVDKSESTLYTEGRAAKLRLLNGRPSDLSRLSSLAQCAGFDYVKVIGNNDIEVCVKPQQDTVGELVSFPLTQLFVADLPDHVRHEYSYPKHLKEESRIIKLLDGSQRKLRLSQHFLIEDFAYPGKRYFRLDVKLLECLENVKSKFPNFRILEGSGFRTRYINSKDIDSRHKDERYRFQTGQAVELSVTNSELLYDLAHVVARSCLRVFNTEHMTLGLGAHRNKLYVDLSPQPLVDNAARMKVWEAEPTPWFKNLKSFASVVNKGGSLIDPVNDDRACKEPKYGQKFYFISQPFSKKKLAFSKGIDFCKETLKHRNQGMVKLKDNLKNKGNQLYSTEKYLEECFVTNCGPGLGFGEIWEKKVASCLKFLSNFVAKASIPFGNVEKTSFFNSANTNSSVHSLACDTSLCLENTQIYSFLKELLMTRYKPKAGESIEEMIYDSRDNPNPSLNLLEQFLAMSAVGEVNVYIEKDRDFSALRNVLKILLVFNQNISFVTIHVSENVNKGKIQDNLSRTTEFWATGECPRWSKVSIAPFSVVRIAKHRLRRSVELSEVRNKRMADVHNWEMTWLTKN